MLQTKFYSFIRLLSIHRLIYVKKLFLIQDLINHFKKLHGTKIGPVYAKFLIGIVENYFGVDVPLMDVSSMLGLL